MTDIIRRARAALIAAAILPVLQASSVYAQQGPQFRVLSSRPDLATGGDALVRIDLPAGTAATDVKVTVNGTDVTPALRADRGGLIGLVTGMANGSNTLTATARGRTASATLVNHPITGPLISSPQEQPFVCMTDRFKLQSGGTLGKPLDADCSIATRVDYVYRARGGKDLVPLANPKAVPADVAVTTVEGREVPFVVRIETGTVNRSIYQIAMLHDPSREQEPDFLGRPAGWNGRLIFTFGGGCEPGWYQQGASTGGVLDDVHLQRGYAVASASLDVAGNNCNDLISAETMMMVKERFIERYGAPMFTIGWGSSGGAIQQHAIADNYPGLLDGLITGRSFADTAFASSTSSGDSRLLLNYFDKLAGPVAYTDEQKRAIAGFANAATISNLSRVRAPRYNATERCPEGLPAEQKYDPVKNPKGARCTIWDHGATVYGRDPRTGFARRPLDNTGIQYGLEALNGGAITKEQFLDLNEKIGGFDIDGSIVAARMVADTIATRAAYRSGRLVSGGGGLATVPIIDYRTYYDDLPAGDVHLRFQSFTTRARLEKANGYSDNRVMLLQDRRYGDFDTTSPVLADALAQMDQWLSSLALDDSSATPIAKLRKARPANLVDACWTKDEVPQKIEEKQEYRSGRCNELYPSFSFPRGVAGAPIANDIIKCQVKPIAAADYTVTFTGDELSRLRKIFPAGACDWSKPGVEQQRLAGTWQAFGPRASGGTGAP
ncbi:MAG TPA: DUF6351 family protein [Vicinamibacterales bacterium]